MMICLEDYEEEACNILERSTWGYYYSGATTELTLKDNREAFNRYIIRPRILCDVSSVNLSTTILGNHISFPVCVSPTGMQCAAHSMGEKATAKACQRAGTCMTLSSWSTTGLEDVGVANGNGLRWYQVEIYKDAEITEQLVKRAETAGYKAIVVTIDIPVAGIKWSDHRYQFTLPDHLTLPHFKHFSNDISNSDSPPYFEQLTARLVNPKTTWESLDWLRSVTSLPIVLKGILRADDAREALKHDIQGIIVSNHGARQLDTVPATIDALSEVVREVKGQVEVYIDGGIRHGTDVLKALSLGARAVFIGRPVIYGLACNGEEGVYNVLNILKEETRQAFTLSGCCDVNSVQTIKDLVVNKECYPVKSHL